MINALHFKPMKASAVQRHDIILTAKVTSRGVCHTAYEVMANDSVDPAGITFSRLELIDGGERFERHFEPEEVLQVARLGVR